MPWLRRRYTQEMQKPLQVLALEQLWIVTRHAHTTGVRPRVGVGFDTHVGRAQMSVFRMGIAADAVTSTLRDGRVPV
jgi:hypothetical protein